MALPRSISRLIALSPLPRLFAYALRDGAAILMLHAVHDPRAHANRLPPPSSKSADVLRIMLDSVQRTHVIISLDDLADMIEGRTPWRPNTLVLTFDDSLRCMATVAAPMLAEMNLPATFYVSTATIDNGVPYLNWRLDYAVSQGRRPRAEITLSTGRSITLVAGQWGTSMYELKRELLHLSANEYESVVRSLEEQFCTSLAADGAGDLYTAPLTWADVRSMHQLGMTVGGHTVTHCNLTLLGPEALRQELRHSRERIEAEVGVPCRHLCYPQGLYDERVIEAAKECGYRTGVTASQGFNRCRDNLYALRRWGMQAEPYKVIRMITGMDDAVQRVTRFFKRAG